MLLFFSVQPNMAKARNNDFADRFYHLPKGYLIKQ